MIEFRAVHKFYGEQDILVDASFLVSQGERVGIVGPNGTGKSTLFSLIDRTVQPDKGDLQLPKGVRLGHLRQQLNSWSVTDSLLAYTTRAIPELDEVQARIHEVEHALEGGSGDKVKLLQTLGELQTRFETLGGYELLTRAKTALSGLGFSVDAFDEPFASFSGGWQMRAEMARTLIGYPDILMLDEPSNYLDLPAVEWLQKFLKSYNGTILLISHDRFLLRTLTNATIEISGGQLTKYQGGFDYYLRERESRHLNAMAAKKNQDRKIEQIERFVERFRSKNTKAAQVQSRIKMLDKMDRIDVPDLLRERTAIRVPAPPHCGNEVARLEDVGHTYDGNVQVLAGVNLSLTRGDKIALVGYNGMGKTTLQRILAGTLAPSSGKRVLGHKVVAGYQSQDFAETMNPAHSAYDIVKAAHPESDGSDVRSLLGSFGFEGDQAHKLCKILSGGEKIRLAFARIFIHPPNFLILDEPTTHLDLAGRNALEQALQDYAGTLCLVSHDLTFVESVANRIVAMTPPGITVFPGGYAYYREKAGGLDPAPPTGQDGTASTVRADKKAQRRERARTREERKATERDLKRRIRKAEAAIESLEAEQAGLIEQLSSSSETVDFDQVNRRLSEIQRDLSEQEAEWEQASLAFEAQA